MGKKRYFRKVVVWEKEKKILHEHWEEGFEDGLCIALIPILGQICGIVAIINQIYKWRKRKKIVYEEIR